MLAWCAILVQWKHFDRSHDIAQEGVNGETESFRSYEFIYIFILDSNSREIELYTNTCKQKQTHTCERKLYPVCGHLSFSRAGHVPFHATEMQQAQPVMRSADH